MVKGMVVYELVEKAVQRFNRNQRPVQASRTEPRTEGKSKNQSGTGERNIPPQQG